jgi:hypothetical protein
MADLGIVTFDRIGVCLAFRDSILAIVIPEIVVERESITVILLGFGRFIHHFLDTRFCALPDQFPAQKATRLTVYDGNQVDLVFLWPIKVNNSSISAVFTSFGTGTAGKASAWALTHREMVR